MNVSAWTQTLATLGGTITAMALACLLQQLAVRALRSALLAAQPLVGEPDELRRYERGLLTPGSTDLRWVRVGIALAGLAAWYGWTHNGPAAWAGWAAATLLLAAAIGWDVWTGDCVAASPWQVAWRRGWRNGVRRIHLGQVAAIHVVERPATSALARLAQRLGWRPGTAYLAVEFHSGRAAKLPRTDLALGLREVQRVATCLRKRQRQAARERRHAIHEELRARRRAPRLLPDEEEIALKRELAALKLRGLTRPTLLLE